MRVADIPDTETELLARRWRWSRVRFETFMRLRGQESPQYIADQIGARLEIVEKMDALVAQYGAPKMFTQSKRSEDDDSFGLGGWRDVEVRVPDNDPLLVRLIKFHGKRREYVDYTLTR
jgi:hypothetical protein